MPKRSRATLKGLALAKLQRLDGAAYRGHPRKTDIGIPITETAMRHFPRAAYLSGLSDIGIPRSMADSHERIQAGFAELLQRLEADSLPDPEAPRALAPIDRHLTARKSGLTSDLPRLVEARGDP
jgi:hypothetical protein